MDAFAPRRVAAAYDTVASAYADAFFDDLMRLPVDRAVLDELVERVREGDAGGAGGAAAGAVLEVGCGPAQVSAYLAARGLAVVATDLALGMLTVARQRTGLTALVGADMRALPSAACRFAAVVAYYSVQHLPRADLPVVLREVRRVLQPGGLFVVATHLGDGEVLVEEFLGRVVAPVGGTFYARSELEARVAEAGFEVVSVRERGPMEHEHPSQRIYVVARRR